MTLTGHVRDAGGQPVPGGSLFAYDLDQPYSDQSDSPLLVRTDAEGKFQYRLGSHRYFVRASVRDGGMGTTEVDLQNGAPEDLTIRVPAAAEVMIAMEDTVAAGSELRIQDPAGRVLWGLTVTILWPRSLELPPGDYLLLVRRADGREDLTSFTAPADDPTTLPVR